MPLSTFPTALESLFALDMLLKWNSDGYYDEVSTLYKSILCQHIEFMAIAYIAGLGTLDERDYFRDCWGEYKPKLRKFGLETDIVDKALTGETMEDQKRNGLTGIDGVLVRWLDLERRIYKRCVDHRVLIRRLDLERRPDGGRLDIRVLARRLNWEWTNRGQRICRERKKGIEDKQKVVSGNMVVDFVKVEEGEAGRVKVNGQSWEVVNEWRLQFDAAS